MTAPAPYPLTWPEGWPRTPRERRHVSRFKVASFAVVRDRVLGHLRLMGATRPVITSNLPARADGLPYANAAEPADPGIAVYWRALEIGRPAARDRVIACDRWTRTRDNLHAIELSLEALRGLDRWGSTEVVERAFQGFAALPPAPGWRETFPGCATLDEVRATFRKLAAAAHPDSGGSEAAMQELSAAYAAAKAELAPERPALEAAP